MYLTASDPLFVDAAAGNFYPAEGSPIIDSALISTRQHDHRARAAGDSDSPIRRQDRRVGNPQRLAHGGHAGAVGERIQRTVDNGEPSAG